MTHKYLVVVGLTTIVAASTVWSRTVAGQVDSSLTAVDDKAATILKRADQALYRAKRDGRNRVVADAA